MDLVRSIIWLFEEFVYFERLHLYEIFDCLMIIIVFLFSCLIAVLMWFFFSFHRKIMYENKTTIETLEMKNKPYESKYNISMEHNVKQIMGTKLWLWPIPIMPAFAKPKGEGIYFDKNVESEEDEDSEDTPEEDNNAGSAHSRQDRYQQNTTSGANDSRPPYGQATSNGGVASTADRMTVHNNETINKRDNLNHIVQSDYTGVAYKSSDEDNTAMAVRQGNTQFANSIDNQAYEDMKRDYFIRQQVEQQKEAARPLAQKSDQNRIDSKSSTSHMMRMSRSPDGGQNVANMGRESKYVSPGQKPKGKPKKATAKAKNVKRGTATSKNRIGTGYR